MGDYKNCLYPLEEVSLMNESLNVISNTYYMTQRAVEFGQRTSQYTNDVYPWNSCEGKAVKQDLQNGFNQLPLISVVTAFCYSTFNTQIL